MDKQRRKVLVSILSFEDESYILKCRRVCRTIVFLCFLGLIGSRLLVDESTEGDFLSGLIQSLVFAAMGFCMALWFGYSAALYYAKYINFSDIRKDITEENHQDR